MMTPFRIEPKMPVQSYKTYGLARPTRTHWRKATCAEVECPPYLHGWATTVLADSGDENIIRSSGRKWIRIEPLEGGFRRYVFGPGQQCFAAARHRVQLERPGLFVVRDGDWRGNPTGYRRLLTGQQWVEDFGEHQERIVEQFNRG